MRMRLLAVSAALAMMGWVPSAPAQTFDCSTAYRPDEKIICELRRLQRLDEQLAAKFREVMAASGEHRQRLVRVEHEAWEASRHQCRADAACIRMHYRIRLRELAVATEPEPARRQSACTLFREFGYRGQGIEVGPGEQISRLDDAWNNSVSSVRVGGRCQLIIFSSSRYRGQSATVSESISRLSGFWNDEISSVRCDCR